MNHRLILVSISYLCMSIACAFGETPPAPADALKADIEHFQLIIHFQGPKPAGLMEKLTLTAGPGSAAGERVAEGLFLHIDPDQAKKLIDELAADQLLHAPSPEDSLPPRAGYGITAKLTNDAAFTYVGNLGFDLGAVQHLDAMRQHLAGDAADQMQKLLLNPMKDLRRQWEEDHLVFNRDALAVQMKPTAIFPDGIAPKFEITLINTGPAGISLSHDCGNAQFTGIDIRGADGKDYRVIPPRALAEGNSITLAAIGSHTATLSLSGCQFLPAHNIADGRPKPLPHLPPGKYQARLHTTFSNMANSDKEVWSGEVIAGWVAFEIGKEE